MTSARVPFLAGLALLFAVPAASAATLPLPGRTDARLRTAVYDPDQVIRLHGAYGYQTVIEFGEDERLENVSIGDSQGWQVTPNRRANLLFVKPLEGAAHPTNMTVITNGRRYSFELAASAPSGPDDPDLTFALRFRYPEEEAARAAAARRAAQPPPATAPKLNLAFRYSGAPALAPAHVYDDGEATHFTFRRTASAPAIYALNAAGEESLVNYRVAGDDLVVQSLAPTFVLRSGKQTGYVRNDGYGLQAASAPSAGRWTAVGGAR